MRDLAEAITPHYRTVIYLAASTGLRAGEVWGLRVKDLDLLKGKLHTRQTLLEVDGTLAYDTPKNHAARTVYLPGFLREMIGADLARRDPSPPPANALVFVTPRGKPVHHSNFMRRHFRPAVKGRPESKRRRGTAGYPAIPSALAEELHGLRFHDLRHTAASIAAANGAQPKDVQQMLGHSSIQITMDRYTHLFPEHQEALAERMDAAYRESTPTPVAEVVALR